MPCPVCVLRAENDMLALEQWQANAKSKLCFIREEDGATIVTIFADMTPEQEKRLYALLSEMESNT